MRHMRWMIRADLSAVLKIDRASFDDSWDLQELLACLRQNNTIGVVCLANEHGPLLGYSIYELMKQQIHVVALAVDPDHRRQGVGSDLIKRLQGKLSRSERRSIVTYVRETNLPAQLMLRANGFTATRVARDWYGDGTDAYRMRYELPLTADEKERLLRGA